MEKIIRPLSAHAAFLCIALVGLTQTGCSKSTSADTSTTASATTAQAPSAVPASAPAQKAVSTPASVNRGPRIKGIALGDSPDQVRQALAVLVSTTCNKCLIQTPPLNTLANVDPNAKTVIELNRPLDLSEKGTGPFGDFYVAGFNFDANQHLFSIWIRGNRIGAGTGLMDDLFNATNLSLAEFAQAFIDAYGIPKLDTAADGESLQFTDRDNGWQLTIAPDKELHLEVVDTASQQAKNFN